MSIKMGHERRAFVRMLAALVASSGIPRVAWPKHHSPNVKNGFPFDEIVTDRLGARSIGHEYLRTHPSEADAVHLADVLETTVAPAPIETVSLRELREAFEARQMADFESGNIVTVNGWVLSRTEARLCALCAIAWT